jgi:antitoxin (DNA-binding transcriptional repressor) of toxin-antitoxin stability system
MRMELREANQHFSKAVKLVTAGEEVVLMERGKPITVIEPLDRETTGEAQMRRLEVSGVLRPASKPSPLPSWTPRPLRGEPLSRTLREERDAS